MPRDRSRVARRAIFGVEHGRVFHRVTEDIDPRCGSGAAGYDGARSLAGILRHRFQRQAKENKSA